MSNFGPLYSTQQTHDRPVLRILLARRTRNSGQRLARASDRIRSIIRTETIQEFKGNKETQQPYESAQLKYLKGSCRPSNDRPSRQSASCECSSPNSPCFPGRRKLHCRTPLTGTSGSVHVSLDVVDCDFCYGVVVSQLDRDQAPSKGSTVRGGRGWRRFSEGQGRRRGSAGHGDGLDHT